MNFVVNLLESKEYDTMWIVGNRKLKIMYLIPYHDETDEKKRAAIFIHEVFKLHGLPDTTVSNCGPQSKMEL